MNAILCSRIQEAGKKRPTPQNKLKFDLMDKDWTRALHLEPTDVLSPSIFLAYRIDATDWQRRRQGDGQGAPE